MGCVHLLWCLTKKIFSLWRRTGQSMPLRSRVVRPHNLT
jgi:hypothetical protein